MSGVRASLTWLHTWAGVVLGSLLFAIFWMGTLSVFDLEIDRWMMPATRVPAPQARVSLDQTALPVLQRLAPNASQWQVTLPDERSPTLQVLYRQAGQTHTTHLDPVTGAILPDPGTLAGSGFLYPFHYMLHIRAANIGSWIVGLAGMGMLVLLVSGVVIHRKILREFFTFRPRKSLQRASLDLHNLFGVLALPFHFVIALSGLVIMFAIYFPGVIDSLYRDDKPAFFADAFSLYSRKPAGVPGTIVSLDAALDQARREWLRDQLPTQASILRIAHPGDANAYLEIHHTRGDSVSAVSDAVYIDAATGSVLHRFEAAPTFTVQRFISGMHLIQFEHWTLRWLYFLSGLAGSIVIGTGFIVWIEARRARHARHHLPGVRIVEGIAVASITGIIVATLMFFIANRLLPAAATLGGFERAQLEIWIFFFSWTATLVHAFRRHKQAWREQTALIAAAALVAVLLNWVTTGDHLLRAIEQRLWSVAGMDALLLVGAATGWYCCRKLRQSEVMQAAFARDEAEHA